MIQTVIFDLGNVIVPFDFARAYAKLEPLCAYPAAEIPARLRSTDLVTRFETGKIAPGEFVFAICSLLELRVTEAEFRELWTSIFLPEPLIPESFITGLKPKYRLLLLSNTNAIHFDMIQHHYPLVRHFHHAVLSYEVGALKPSEAIYRAALDNAGCRPEQCFFTDDIQAYVDAAQTHGIDAVRFESFAQIEAALRDRGVVPA